MANSTATQKVSRRTLLRAPASVPQLLFRPEREANGDVLVVVFLRGAMDGVHTVPPIGDDHYHKQRPTLAIPEPGKANGALNLDGFFGLHPELAPLHELWQARRMAIVHASGSPDRTLSHFEAMQTMERGVSDGNTTASGWLSRHLACQPGANPSPVRALAFGDVLPKSLQGALGATAVRSLKEFRLGVPEGWGAGYRSLLTSFYADGEDPAATAGRSILELLQTLEKLDPDTYQPERAAKYPDTPFGRGLRQVAQLIKADVGLEVASVDLEGWDAHVAQVALMTGLMKQLGGGLRALHDDLGDRTRSVTILAMTEFGRRVHENSGLGTDHGRASAMFLLGGGIRGGKVYGKWPGVAPGQLDKDGNLRVTTDYRDILGEIVTKRLGNPKVGQVFPDYTPRPLELADARG